MRPSIKTGICSYGMSGKLFHAPFIEAHPGLELTVIVERSKDEAKLKYPNTKIYRSVDELFADPEIELIVVNTPVQTHYEFAGKALAAGKNVVVEKPFTVTSKEAAELTVMATQKNLMLSVYQNRRYDGDFRAIRAVVETGILGDLKEMEIRFDRYRPGLSGKQHKEGSLPGSGNLYDLGPHIIDQALQLFGWPQQVFADIWTMRDNVPSDDYFELLLYYNGLRVRLKGTVMARESYYAYVLHGNKGSFLQQRSDLQEEQLLAGAIPAVENWCQPNTAADGLLHTEINGAIVKRETHSSPGNYMDYYQGIYQCLTAAANNPVAGQDGEKTIRIIEAAFQSVKEKRVISLS
jgi:scyllo-inositol 2-dehydrogenase (NADP+)